MKEEGDKNEKKIRKEVESKMKGKGYKNEEGRMRVKTKVKMRR